MSYLHWLVGISAGFILIERFFPWRKGQRLLRGPTGLLREALTGPCPCSHNLPREACATSGRLADSDRASHACCFGSARGASSFCASPGPSRGGSRVREGPERAVARAFARDGDSAARPSAGRGEDACPPHAHCSTAVPGHAKTRPACGLRDGSGAARLALVPARPRRRRTTVPSRAALDPENLIFSPG